MCKKSPLFFLRAKLPRGNSPSWQVGTKKKWLRIFLIPKVRLKNMEPAKIGAWSLHDPLMLGSLPKIMGS